MQPASEDTSALTWGLRRYAVPLAALVLAVAVAAVAATSWLASRAQYSASALVIASELQVRQEQLPRFGESVFTSGSVARDVAMSLGIADHRTLVPDRISLDPIPETIAFHVRGHSDDAEEAAELANVAAEAFVAAVNRAGAGVGVFRLQDPAFVPLSRDVGPISPPVAAVVGLAAGGLLAASVLSLLIALRGPLISPDAAASATGLPLLAVVTLPRGRRSRHGPALGLRNLTAALPGLPASVVELAGPGASGRARRDLLELLRKVERPTLPPGTVARRVVVADVTGAEEIVLRVPRPPGALGGDAEPVASVLIVVAEGAGAAAVRDSARAFLPAELAGTVFVRRRRTSRLPAVAPPAAPARDSAGQPAADRAPVA